jgi:hypothetical protein
MKRLSGFSRQLSACRPLGACGIPHPPLMLKFPKEFPAKPFMNSFSSYDAGASGV